MATKLYIANLGKYNEGELVGDWINLPFTDDEWTQLMDKIHICHDDKKYYNACGCPYEEIAIHDFETDFPYSFGEYEDINRINDAIYSFNEYAKNKDKSTILEIMGAVKEYNSETNLCTLIDKVIEVINAGDFRMFTDVDDMSDIARIYISERDDVINNTIPQVFLQNFNYSMYGEVLETEGNFYWPSTHTCIEFY